MLEDDEECFEDIRLTEIGICPEYDRDWTTEGETYGTPTCWGAEEAPWDTTRDTEHGFLVVDPLGQHSPKHANYVQGGGQETRGRRYRARTLFTPSRPRMGSIEFVLGYVACFQPLVIGLAAFLGLGRLVPAAAPAGQAGSTRTTLSAYRFFECATYSRLGSRLSYNMQTFSICMAFLLYDLDLFFFLPEAVHFETNSPFELGFLALYLLFFMGGLWFDYTRFGFEWAM